MCLGEISFVHDAVKSLLGIVYTDLFQRGQRVGGEVVFGSEVDQVLLHTLLFFRIGVVVERRLMTDDGWNGSGDSNSGMTGKAESIFGQVHKSNIKAVVGFDLSDYISDTT